MNIHTLQEEQLERQERSEIRAKNAHISSQRKLKEINKESALNYGQYLFSVLIDDLSKELDIVEKKNELLSVNLDKDFLETLIRQKLKFGKSTEKVYLIQKEND